MNHWQKMEKFIIFATSLCYFCIVNSLEFQTIGVYSICGENYDQNEFTQFGYTINLTVFAILEHRNYGIKEDGVTNYTFHYKSFDVCYDTEKLVSIATDLLLDSEFYAVNESIVWEEERKVFEGISYVKKLYHYHITARRSTMIVRIVVHIPGDMLQILLNIMSLESIPISKHSSLVKSNERMYERPNFFNLEYSFTDVEKYLKSKMFEDIIVLHLKVGNIYTSDFNGIVKMLNAVDGICLKTLTIDDESKSLILIKNIEEIYNKNRTKHFILILVGGSKHHKIKPATNYWKYVNYSSSYQKNLVAISPYIISGFFQLHWFNWAVTLFDVVRENVVELRNIFKQDLGKYPNIYQNRNVNLTVQNNLGTFSILLLLFETEQLTFNSLITHQKWSDLMASLRQRFNNQLTDFKNVWEVLPPNIRSKCQQQSCPPGYEKVYGKVPNKTTFWDEEIGYYCKPCKLNYVKSSYGHAGCQPCVNQFISNPDKTKCIDPILLIHRKPGDTPGIITLGICSVGGVFCLLAIAIFIKYRETPIVKTSDFTMSLIHINVTLLFFCNIPALYFTYPTTELCMAKTLSIALLYNLNISIIYTKSNKLVKAFSAKIRSTKTEVLKTTLKQVFIIKINLMFACLLVTALWSHKYPGLDLRLDIQNSKKFLYCNNGYDNITLCGLMLLLHLACFIQAFRCRKLPGHLNDAMNIVYASFIVTVSLCVMFPIAFFQKYEENEEMVLALVLSGNNMVLFMFMYAKKLFIIIFCSEKNTKQYFRKKQLEMIEVKARQI